MNGTRGRAGAGFQESLGILRCPLCRGGFQPIEAGSLRCPSGHSFDVAARGYVNLLPGYGRQRNQGTYDRGLFEARNQVFRAGYYDQVVAELETIILEYFPGDDPIRILDAGCGEGFYAASLWERESLRRRSVILGLDIVKEAVQLACRTRTGVKWVVGNLADLPFQDESIDVLLNILSPANYGEFRRVLKPEGILIKAIPGSDYLKEIRSAVSDQLLRKRYSSERIVDHLARQMELLQRREVSCTLPLSPELAASFLQMTPLTSGVDVARVCRERLTEITIHLEFLIGRKRTGG